MRFDIIDDIDRLKSLRDNWDHVYRSDPEAPFFLSGTWIYNWIERIHGRWLILAAGPLETDAPYVAFFPIVLTTVPGRDGKWRNEINMAGIPLAGYAGFICDSAHDRAAIPALAAALRSLNWARLRLLSAKMSEARRDIFLDEFPADAFTIRSVARKTRGEETNYSTYPFLELPTDWETYLETRLNAKMRNKVRRCFRELDSGKLRVTLADAGTIDEDLDALARFWLDKWQPTYGPDRAREEIGNHLAMIKACFAANEALVPVLWQGDRRIGVRASLIDRKSKTLVCLVGTRDMAVNRPPPGFVLHNYCIRWAIENGFRTYDLQIGNHAYKYDFASDELFVPTYLVETVDGGNLRGQLDPRSVGEALSLAARFYRLGQFDEAETGCRQVLTVTGENREARELLAMLTSPAFAQARNDLAEANGLLQRGAAAEAERKLRPVVAVHPGMFDALYLFGLACLLQDNFEAAESSFGKAAAVNAGSVPLQFYRGSGLLRLGRANDAQDCFTRAIAMAPGNPDALGLRARAFAMLGRIDEAVADLDKAIELKPEFEDAHRLRDSLLARQ
jgi:CelD/BcsL family acetyltransferase involved in cellulose biosynthesis